jgi:hypothetical protein
MANSQVHLDEMSRCERNSPIACECRNVDETCPSGGSSFAMIRTSYTAGAGVNFRPSRPSALRTKKTFGNIAINDAASAPCVSGERGEESACSARSSDSQWRNS